MSSHSQRAKKHANVIYSNGVEITSSIIEFSGWHPGFEYTKNLNFKNLNTKTVKLMYVIPKTKTFTTLFPKQIALSPGTTFSLPITFRPLNKVDYYDELELHQLDFDTKLSVKLVAKLPQFKLEIQESLNLGCACVNEIISGQVVLNNKR
jgi:cilia- and flagella-associated protein 65